MNTVNPYAPPRARVSDVGEASSEAEVIRREHLKHEASIRSVGVLYYLGGAALVLAAVGTIGVLSGRADQSTFIAMLAFVVYIAFGVFSIFVGRGVRRLRSWARTASTVLAVIGLLAFPVGTLVNGYILYLLHSAKGKRIFAADYPAI